MSQKIPKQISHLQRTSSKLGETTTISRAGALFFLAMAHEVAKSKTFEPLNDVQQLLGAGRKVSVSVPNEESLVLQANFDDLLAVSIPLEQAAVNLDETFEAISRMGQDGEAVVLAQSSWTTNRAPVSDAGVDYIDHSYVAPDTSAAAVAEPAAASSVAPVVVEAEPIAAAVAEGDSAALIFDRNLLLDVNALPATSAGPLVAVAGFGPVGAVAAGAGALALAGGGGGGASGGAVSLPINNTATISNQPGQDKGQLSASTTMANGKFNVQDADIGQAFMQTQNNVVGNYGTFNVSGDGAWTYVLNPALNTFKALPKDGVGVDTFTVKSLDGSAQKTVTVDVVGLNDAPVISSMAQLGTLQEDGVLKATGQVTASDIDAMSTLSFSSSETMMAATQTGVYGTFAVDALGAWTYDLDNASVQNFKASTVAKEVFTVFVRDEFGAQASQAVTLQISGTNDAPVVTDITPSMAARTIQETPGKTGDQTSHVLSGTFKVSDVDATSLSEISLSNPASSAGLGGQLVLSGINQTNGLVSWTYQIKDAELDFLAAGNTVTDTQTFDVSDGNLSSKVSIDVLLLGADTTLM